MASSLNGTSGERLGDTTTYVDVVLDRARRYGLEAEVIATAFLY